MDENWMEQFQKQNLSTQVLLTNQYTQKYGLVLSQEDTELILEGRKNALQEQRRVEFGESILPRIIFEFCDSAYIRQDNYTQTLLRLQEIFFLYKNEMEDEITDDELLHFMKEQFETICYGDLEYLEGTCLTGFAEAIRAGYRGYKESEGYGEYAQFDAVPRWDYNLYLETLKELFWE
ncbi:MAG: hypothetical protein KA965_11425 [Butyrivibrio sp.]|nr:hypothetical protein [Butyrivibrio sp.]